MEESHGQGIKYFNDIQKITQCGVGSCTSHKNRSEYQADLEVIAECQKQRKSIQLMYSLIQLVQ